VLPNVPTLAELGVKDFDVQIWHGLFAPAKTPERVIRAVHKGAMAALSAPEVRERFAQLGFMIIGNTPEEFAVVVRRETEKFRKVITDAGIKAE
jgi:tripartite-type tricarboxylate transporter receptor subunit TctC